MTATKSPMCTLYQTPLFIMQSRGGQSKVKETAEKKKNPFFRLDYEIGTDDLPTKKSYQCWPTAVHGCPTCVTNKNGCRSQQAAVVVVGIWVGTIKTLVVRIVSLSVPWSINFFKILKPWLVTSRASAWPRILHHALALTERNSHILCTIEWRGVLACNDLEISELVKCFTKLMNQNLKFKKCSMHVI